MRETARRYAMRRQLDVPDEYKNAVRARMQAAISQTSRDTASWLHACRVTGPELELRLADEALVAWFSARLPSGVDAVDMLPAPIVNGGQVADPGLYLRVFSTDQERRACQYVCLSALLERESLTLQSFDSLAAAWEWAALRLVQESLEN